MPTTLEGDTSRRLKRGLALLALLASSLAGLASGLVVALFAFNTVNPMTLMFATSFEVLNGSGEDVRIWVAGTGESGQLGLLPLYASTMPAIPAFRNGGFRLTPGDTVRIKYDWDDYNFTMIIVRNQADQLFVHLVDTEDPQPGCCWRHRKERYQIPPLSQLRAASIEERHVIDQGYTPWMVLGPAFVLPLVPLYFYRLQKRFGPYPQDGGAERAA